MAEQAGGKLESCYFAFGEADAYAIVELPEPTVAAAVSLAVNALGLAHFQTVPLITPEELDAAIRKASGYRPPGAEPR